MNNDRNDRKADQRVINRDREKIERDTKQFGANSPQVMADKKQLTADETKSYGVQKDINQQQDQNQDRAVAKGDQRAINRVREKMERDTKQFGANSPQVAADKKQLAADETKSYKAHREVTQDGPQR